MVKQLNEEQIYKEARKRVKEKKDFLGHFGAWVAVNIMLIVIWALTDFGGDPWFLWPLCIWGVFVALHFVRVYVIRGKPESIDIEKEVERIKREQGGNIP